jgi:hypothetical protein
MAVAERRKPWYLIAALLGALLFGVGGACNGYQTVAIYRGEAIDPSAFVQGITDDVDRAAVSAQFEHLFGAMDAARDRGWPLGIAALLVGSAVILYAMRAMSGRGGARAGLVQLIIVQAGLNVASYWLLRDVTATEEKLEAANIVAKMHEQVPERSRADEMARVQVRLRHLMPPVFLALRILGSALIVFALTRPRSREFFEAASDPAIEQ